MLRRILETHLFKMTDVAFSSLFHYINESKDCELSYHAFLKEYAREHYGHIKGKLLPLLKSILNSCSRRSDDYAHKASPPKFDAPELTVVVKGSPSSYCLNQQTHFNSSQNRHGLCRHRMFMTQLSKTWSVTGNCLRQNLKSWHSNSLSYQWIWLSYRHDVQHNGTVNPALVASVLEKVLKLFIFNSFCYPGNRLTLRSIQTNFWGSHNAGEPPTASFNTSPSSVLSCWTTRCAVIVIIWFHLLASKVDRNSPTKRTSFHETSRGLPMPVVNSLIRVAYIIRRDWKQMRQSFKASLPLFSVFNLSLRQKFEAERGIVSVEHFRGVLHHHGVELSEVRFHDWIPEHLIFLQEEYGQVVSLLDENVSGFVKYDPFLKSFLSVA